jgi:PAS domain S-box-containing protein
MPQSLIDLAGLQVGAEEFLAAVLGATEQPIWVVDPDGVIRFANPAAISALGYERVEELLGCHSHEKIHYSHPDGTPYPAEDCPMLLPRATGETVSSDLDWFFRRDGSMFPVAYVSAPIEMHDGRGAVVAFTDIEDRVRAEQRLRDHDAALGAQQASLRRVATLVAGGAVSKDVFAAIAREVATVTGVPLVAIWRYEPDDTATVVGVWSDHPHRFEAGTRWPLDGPTITAQVLRARRPVRIDDWADLPGTIADAARDAGITGAVGVPIVVDGEVWGALSIDSTNGAPLPDDVEERLLEFTELVAAAFATTARQEELARLAEEQAALRRVATLVARGVPSGELFALVTEEIGRLLKVDAAATIRYEPEGVVTAVGSWSAEGVEAETEVGRQWPLAGESLAPRILKTGQPARIDDWNEVSGPIAEYSRTRLKLTSSVGTPIVVDGRVWGNIAVHSTSGRLPPDTEARIARFTELVSTAILNAEARAEVERLADEQAALRRVATVVAREREAPEVFATVAEEVGRLLPVEDAAMLRYEDDGSALMVASWGTLSDVIVPGMRLPVDGDNITARVRRTGQPARIDDYASASGSFGTRMRELGIGAAIGCPIVVDGRLWGTMVAAQGTDKPLPPDTELRVEQFTELIATAISNLQARGEVGRLAAEQAALRRVATLVAEGASPSAVLDAVAAEMEALLHADQVALNRFEAGDEILVLAHRGLDVELTPVGSRVSIGGESATALVRHTGRPARMENYESAGGAIAELARTTGLRSSVSAPISVQGALWGVITASWKREESPAPDTEDRMVKFTALIATAIANADSREAIGRLAGEQAALRRVATRVAEAVPPNELFDVVVEEVGTLLRSDLGGMIRYEADGTVTAVATWAADGEHPPVEGRWSLEGDRLATTITRTRRPGREDDWENAEGPIAEFVRTVLGIRSSVGSPVIVEGQVWGALFVHSKQEGRPLPLDTETRLTNFAELVATAVSNAQARAEVTRLAEEQAALRRVATLVAEERPSSEVFAAVAGEVGRVLHLDATGIVRFEAEGDATIVASWGQLATALPGGTRVSLEGGSASSLVFRTGRPARLDDLTTAAGSFAATLRELGARSSIAIPIAVDGRLWGALTTTSVGSDPFPADTEARMRQFTELVATAITNIRTRSELAASRARIVAAADDERRRVVRDLHDGAQQRLVHTVITLKLAARAFDAAEDGRPLLGQALDQAERATQELRELSHGVLPAVLARGGLRAGVEALATRASVPVVVHVSDDRLPAAVEATGYFVVAEALTNVTKHAHATRAEVTASVDDRTLRVLVSDDGVGGAEPDGSGLVGLADRVAALDGRFRVESPENGGTLIAADIPLPERTPERATAR